MNDDSYHKGQKLHVETQTNGKLQVVVEEEVVGNVLDVEATLKGADYKITLDSEGAETGFIRATGKNKGGLKDRVTGIVSDAEKQRQ